MIGDAAKTLSALKVMAEKTSKYIMTEAKLKGYEQNSIRRREK